MTSPNLDNGLTQFISEQHDSLSSDTFCTPIQDHGVNGNLIACLVWLGARQRTKLNKAQLQTLWLEMEAWHNRVTKPLAKMAKDLSGRSDHDAIFLEVYQELQIANTLEQCQLYENSKPSWQVKKHRTPAQRCTDACQNLALYLEMVNVPASEAVKQAFIGLLSASFPTLKPESIQQKLKKSLGKKARVKTFLNQLNLTFDLD